MPPNAAEAAPEAVREAVLKVWTRLPLKKRPKIGEFTVLAGIAARVDSNNYQVLALGAGTRCQGHSLRSSTGSTLHDSHAEVLCRRAFLRWLYSELAWALLFDLDTNNTARRSRPASVSTPNDTPWFCWEPQHARFHLRPGRTLDLHMFVSQPPCGDAAIIIDHDHDDVDDVDGVMNDGHLSSSARTGAKPLARHRATTQGGGGNSDARGGTAPAPAAAAAAALPSASDVESSEAPQKRGVTRRKPGKGIPTLSMSCSDKLAKWNVLGLQGCLLSSLLAEPIYLRAVIASLPFSCVEKGQEAAGCVALQRALVDRIHHCLKLRTRNTGRDPPLPLQLFVRPPEPQGDTNQLSSSAGEEEQKRGGGQEEEEEEEHDDDDDDKEGSEPRRRQPSPSGLHWFVGTKIPGGSTELDTIVEDLSRHGHVWAEEVAKRISREPVWEASVGATGRKEGVTSKDTSVRGCPAISRRRLLLHYIPLKAAVQWLAQEQGEERAKKKFCPDVRNEISGKSYEDVKSKILQATYRQLKQDDLGCRTYVDKWRAMQETLPMSDWIAKPPELEDFTGHAVGIE